MDSPNVERQELEHEAANTAFTRQHAHLNKPVPPRLTPYEPDPSYQLPAATIAGMVRLCGENRRNISNGRRQP